MGLCGVIMGRPGICSQMSPDPGLVTSCVVLVPIIFLRLNFFSYNMGL